MNLVYSLACEAGLIKFESLHDSMAVTPSFESVANAQRFADLIINTCIQSLIDRKYDNPKYSAEMLVNQGLQIGVEMISEKFGVQQ